MVGESVQNAKKKKVLRSLRCNTSGHCGLGTSRDTQKRWFENEMVQMDITRNELKLLEQAMFERFPMY